MRLGIVGWLGVAAWLLTAVPVTAQQTTGTLQGRIEDTTGGALPGVNVEARQPDTGYSRLAVTDSLGVYRLTALPVGRYDISVQLSGFRSVERQGVVINVGQIIDIDFRLEVAAVAEAITVTGEVALIQSANSSVGGVVDIGRIEQLPLNGRQFANLAASPESASASTPTRPRARSIRRRSTAATGATSTTRSTAATTTTIRSAGCSSSSRSRRSRSSISRPSASRPSTAAATAACSMW